MFSRSKLSLVLLVASGGFGCEDKPKPTSEVVPDAGTESVAQNQEIANAVQAAARQAAAAGTTETVADGPPPGGVFPAGGADRVILVGGAPKVALGSAGGEPTLRLNAPYRLSGVTADVLVQLRLGPRQNLPPVQLKLAFSASDTAASAEVVAVGPMGAMQRVPPQLNAAIAALKGSRFQLPSSPSSSSNIQLHIAPGADPGLAKILDVVASGLQIVLVPYPTDALGPDAMWMVSTRETVQDTDVIAHRLFKLRVANPSGVELSLDIKRYSADRALRVAGAPPHTLTDFQAPGQATILRGLGSSIPIRAEVSEQFVGVITPLQGAQQMKVEFQSSVKFSFQLPTSASAPVETGVAGTLGAMGSPAKPPSSAPTNPAGASGPGAAAAPPAVGTPPVGTPAVGTPAAGTPSAPPAP